MGAVEITRLAKAFEGKVVLEEVSITVGEGQLVTLLGPSGCGKTTTLRCVAGLERPDRGEISIGGRLVASGERGIHEPPNRRGIGMVFQSYALWPHMTVFSNVAYPLRIRKRDRKEIRREVMEVLASVDMEQHANRPVTALSGGQQQRVALARAMVARPDVLLFDEPLSNLDAKLRAAMRREIRSVHERAGAASIYVTHDQEEAITLSDLVVVLRAGAIQQVGTPQAIYRRPVNAFVADFVGFDNLLAGTLVEDRGGVLGVRLASGSGRVLASPTTTTPLPIGSPVVVAVRAGDCTVEPLPHGSGSASSGYDRGVPQDGLTGKVVSSLYIGDRIEHTVEVGGERLVVRTPDTGHVGEALATGADVIVHLAVDRAVVVADDTLGGRLDRATITPAIPSPLSPQDPAEPLGDHRIKDVHR